VPQLKGAPKSAAAAEMLVRALKKLYLFRQKQVSKTSPRQPLISRAMKVRLIAEKSPVGNA
jgi:hypothetical protein